jgi:hypothetical protein
MQLEVTTLMERFGLSEASGLAGIDMVTASANAVPGVLIEQQPNQAA